MSQTRSAPGARYIGATAVDLCRRRLVPLRRWGDTPGYLAPPGRDWLVALLLSIFLGSLGVDQVSLDKIGVGLLKRITLGAWASGGFDVILVAVGSMRDAQGGRVSDADTDDIAPAWPQGTVCNCSCRWRPAASGSSATRHSPANSMVGRFPAS